VTDGRTDRWTSLPWLRQDICMASYADVV